MSRLREFERGLIAKNPAVSFDFGMFAPLFINVLIEMFSSCGNDGISRAKEVMKNPTDPWSRYYAQKAAKHVARSNDIQMVGSDMVTASGTFLQYCGECSDEEIDALFTEADEKVIKPHIFL